MDPYMIGVLAWFLSAPIFLILFFISRSRLRALRKKHANLEVSTQKARKDANAKVKASEKKYGWITSREAEIDRLEASASQLRKDIDGLRASYKDKKAVYDRLKQEVALIDEQIAFAELGIYEPHFDFGDSKAFKAAITKAREEQKAMVSSKNATACPTDWMEKRILNAAKQINTANDSMNLTLRENYVALKLDELHLTHEYREQQKREKDERAERARMEREEKKLLAEAAAAAAEERKYQEMLDRARAEAGFDEGKIAELKRALAEAHEKAERAKSMAEMTKSGYVYIISNVGSFGEEVVKIGLTRRLEPDDRVRELGDASVPFTFDTHAMIYSDEAPALETALHREFEGRRVNAANMRKEFFRVTLEEVENAVKRLAPNADFFKDREAQEWHETLSRRKLLLEAQKIEQALPENL